jgi:hypothetical protein
MKTEQDRQIRVFISSTFRDMQAERDLLVKFIFPQLRKLCESRGVTWGGVDLRWGVTDEQAAEGKVLPNCLEEIKHCRSYFIGLLGERYGWIPETLPADLVEHEDWLKEHLHGKTSVTEPEILSRHRHSNRNSPRPIGLGWPHHFRRPASRKAHHQTGRLPAQKGVVEIWGNEYFCTSRRCSSSTWMKRPSSARSRHWTGHRI